jgi:hypothetical protein
MDDIKQNSSGIVSCPVCRENVSGQRFALHLEKCLNGGKRAAARRKPGNGQVADPTASSSISTRRLNTYGSLIVRIKLNNGGKAPKFKHVNALIGKYYAVPIQQKRDVVPFVVFNQRCLAHVSAEQDDPMSG